MHLEHRIERELLPFVEKPSRYLGNELNRIERSPEAVELSLALAFPDLYELGMANLGLQVLYATLGALPWLRTERVYAPAPDAALILRSKKIPLFALESHDPLASFDGIGFSFQTELGWTTVLGMLDLAGITLRAEQRREEEPLVFAGGPGTMNPEPMADFMDFEVIGDGEDVIVEIAECLRALKGRSRMERLQALARIEGVYVPRFQTLETLSDGRRIPSSSAPRVRRRVVQNLDEAPLPRRPLLPLAQLVHDRVTVEIHRGCTRGCRFCQAGYTTRPIRERSPATVLDAMDCGLRNTGWSEVGLLSLASTDHSRISEIVDEGCRAAGALGAGISLPSIRLEGFSMALASTLATLRKTGLTFAPEAASPRLRTLINKWISDEELVDRVAEAARRGWAHVKLYFMIGFPTETDDDVKAIADLSIRALRAGRAHNRSFTLNLGVNTLIPKPWSAFQWAAQIPAEETRRRRQILMEALSGNRAIRVARQAPEESWLEGILCRADRRAGDLIERAFRLGCQLDGWSEHRRTDLWHQALQESGLSEQELLGERSLQDRLPWDFLDIGVTRSFLEREWRLALEGVQSPDCREGRCHACGAMERWPESCRRALEVGFGRRDLALDMPEKAEIQQRSLPTERAQGLRYRILRTGRARFLSNQETMSAWNRALLRIRAPMTWSNGFHVHPRVAFSTAFPQGEESLGDYLDLLLAERRDPAELGRELRASLPEGLWLDAWAEIPSSASPLMAAIQGAIYEIHLLPRPGLELTGLKERVDALMSAESDPFIRRSGTRTEEIDLRGWLCSMALEPEGEGAVLRYETHGERGKMARPKDIIQRFDLPVEHLRVCRMESLVPPSKGVKGLPDSEIWSGVTTRWGLQLLP